MQAKISKRMTKPEGVKAIGVYYAGIKKGIKALGETIKEFIK